MDGFCGRHRLYISTLQIKNVCCDSLICVAYFLSCLTDNRRPDAIVSPYKTFCNHLSSFRHRQLYLPDTRCRTERWQIVGPALIGQVGK